MEINKQNLNDSPPLEDNKGHEGTILVTGASGLVGSHLITTLLNQNKKVRAFYRSQIPSIKNTEKVQWVKGDILDLISLQDAMQQVDLLYHCAAIVSFNPKEKALLHKTNIEGTANVVNTALDMGIKKMVYVSSVAALGRIRDDTILNETMNWTPETSNSEYGKSKYLAEMEVWRGISEGLTAVIVNPTIILGAGNWNNGSTAIFKKIYHEFPWYSEGVTGFVDVADVINAMILLMESDISGQRFILSTENITYKELFIKIAAAFAKKPPHKKLTPLIAQIVWRIEAIRSNFTHGKPLVTKETAKTSMAKVFFDNTKLLQHLPAFQYTPIEQSVKRICNELKEIYGLA